MWIHVKVTCKSGLAFVGLDGKQIASHHADGGSNDLSARRKLGVAEDDVDVPGKDRRGRGSSYFTLPPSLPQAMTDPAFREGHIPLLSGV
jgi:hypothetical protein